jgi:hypothetical protein
MQRSRPSFEELNAYVDNELPADRAADVAYFIAEDVTIARNVAALARLRSTIPEAVDVPALDLPSMKQPHHPRTAWLVAASVGFLLLVSGATFFSMHEQAARSHWLETAMSTHNSWHLPEGDGAEGSATSIRETADQGENLIGAYIPDLSASKLSVVFVDTSPDSLVLPAIVVGYAGTRGCKVTLLATTEKTDNHGEFRFLTEGEISAYGWRTGKMEYLLIAQGMDRERFDLIAESVYRASTERLPFDEETRTALLESRRKSMPCMA